MTKVLYQSMFVFLSMLLLAVLFVLQPSEAPEVQAFQSELRQEFAVAAKQVFGPMDYKAPLALIWSTTENFYQESATQTIALLQPMDGVVDLALMFNSDYVLAKATYSAPLVARAPYEEPVYLVSLSESPASEADELLDPEFQEDLAYREEFGGVVAGESIDADQQPQAPPVQWIDVTDSITGQPYCVAVFYGSVNSYPGACAKEEDPVVIYAN